MKKFVISLLSVIFLCAAATAQVLVGMTATTAYFPQLEGRRVAVLANHTAVARFCAGAPGAAADTAVRLPGAASDGTIHLVDLLHGRGFDVTGIFSPEHGFRGTADAGEHVASSVDAATGIPIRSLYDGNTKRPSDEAMRSFDVLVVDMQDVGLRFYTYYITMLRMMDAHTAVARFCAGAPGAAADTAVRLPGAASDGTIHLVDLLHGRGFDVTGIFSPEHGFRGTADAGEHVASSVDAATGIPIRSLYDGNTKRPSDEAMRSFDVLVVDMQDVGLRFYTYYITMLRMMDACAESGRSVIVLDRPNPNGHHVDGPVLDMKYKSGVGALPIPVLHGLTMGEIARMAVGEDWAASCDLQVVRCRNYTHDTPYELPVAPSPNLSTQRAVYLYPSVCLFEGTVVSLGRGTDKPFEVYGHPDMTGCLFSFTPRPTAGAKHPPLEGRLCHGVDLSRMPLGEARAEGLTLKYVIEACRNLGLGDKFFTPMFEKLIGVGYVREMILAGASEAEIRARWADDVRRFRKLRGRYLLYE